MAPPKGVRPKTRRTVGNVAQQEEALELAIQGWSQNQIADKLGISQPTVCARIEQAVSRRIDPKVEEWRRIEGARLEELRGVAMAIVRKNAAEPEVQLKAIDRVVRVSERLAKLLGADMPVKVDATVTEVSEAEQAWRAELEENRALVAAAEARIKGASAAADGRTGA